MTMSLCNKLGFSWSVAQSCKSSSAFLGDKFRVSSKLCHKRFSSASELSHIMAAAAAETSSSPKVQLYPEKTPLISVFWKEKYQTDAKKYWDMFYKRNANRFFKDRHYLRKEWGHYFSGMGVDPSNGQAQSIHQEKGQAILEIGCGTGNTIYPLIANYPQAYVYACDFSPRAVDLVKAHEDYDENRVKAFVCDVTTNPLSEAVPLASVDVITLIFVLSAIAPDKMPAVVRNLKAVLKPGGCILIRDYAVGDLAQERFMLKDQQLSENFYVRGDGTLAYYFSEDGLQSLFVEEGFECKEMTVYCRQLENRSRKIVMDRRWIQGVFYLPPQTTQLREENVNTGALSLSRGPIEPLQPVAQRLESSTIDTLALGKKLASSLTLETMVEDKNSSSTSDAELIVDLSDGCAAELFGAAPLIEPVEVAVGSYTVYANCLSKENQHTYASTGFILWESAYGFAELLATNPDFLKGKSVLELGCGSVGLCCLISSVAAKKVVATDGDVGSLSLLQDNLHLNEENFSIGSIACHKLEWGNKDDIDVVRAANNGSGYELIIGTDITYVQEAVPLLFETARALLSERSQDPMLVLCHRIRRVAESDIISSAISHGFHVVGHWHCDVPSSSNINEVESTKQSYVESLFKQGLQNLALNYKALQIICLVPLQ